MRIGWTLIVGAVCAFTTLLVPALAAGRTSGIQIAPDQKGVLVNKDVQDQRWTITRNRDDLTVTGNVFSSGGGDPLFLFCQQQDQVGEDLMLHCSGADSCSDTACPEFGFIADVTLPQSFFAPPANVAAVAARIRHAVLRAHAKSEAVSVGHAFVAAARGSGIQITPDQRRVLVNKDVQGQRWSITRNLDTLTVTGNVFLPGGGDPLFLVCEQQDQVGANFVLHCSGAAGCSDTACPAFEFIADVTLPESFFAVPGPSPPAPTCGNGKACGCADTLAGDYAMTADLSCDGPGLTLVDGATLDCQNHLITGPGGDNSFFGIYVLQARGAVVRNCRVTGFRRGVRVDHGSDDRVENVEAFENGDPKTHRQGGYGIDLGTATDCVIDHCNVHDNADEGIHVGGGSDRATVTATTSALNYREQLYLVGNSGAVVTGNVLQGSKQTNAAVFFINGTNAVTARGNVVQDGNLAIRGASTGSVIEDTTQTGSGIRFEGDGQALPSGNLVIRSHVADAFECVRSNFAAGNAVVDTTFVSCTFAAVETGSNSQPAHIVLIDSPLPPQQINLDPQSTLDIGWHLDVEVRDGNGAPVSGATVKVTARDGAAVLSTTTGANGKIPAANVVERRLQGATTMVLTPHLLSASAPGGRSATQAVTIASDTSVILVLR